MNFKPTLQLFGLLFTVIIYSCKSSKNITKSNFENLSENASEFEGKIVYDYSFSDLAGIDISDKAIPLLGKEQHYYISNKNYKAYDENRNWIQLYHGETNSYYAFNKNKTAKKIDVSISTSQRCIVTELDDKLNILGYDCKAIQIESDAATTIYYYSPEIKIDPINYSNHNFGDWNKYLEATAGALSLKFVLISHLDGYIWTSVAKQISKQALEPSEFAFPDEVKLNN